MPFNLNQSRPADIPAVVRQLLAVGKADPTYFDRYLKRARHYLGTILPYADYRALEQERKASVPLPDQVRTAMEQGDWAKTRELSSRIRSLKESLEKKAPLIELGQMIYDAPLVCIDPFSPGLQGFAGVPSTGLAELQQQSIQGLARLEKEDPDWREFYARRSKALETLALGINGQDPTAPLVSAKLQQEALEAFARGNFSRLEKVADLLEQQNHQELAAPGSTQGEPSASDGVDLLFSFSQQTLTQAKTLGLAAARAESWHEKYGQLCRFAWQPAIGGERGSSGEAQRLQDLPIPADTPEAMKDRITMFLIHPLINSGGARYLPSLVAEDLLVEEFPDPAPEAPLPASPLLEALELKQRRGLSRLRIEQALLAHGSEILEQQLSLDPDLFRLVCIPPDLHLRLGRSRGWGQQPYWTHFDGYMLQRDGHRMALAGGDVRFGGVFDLVSLSVNYESEGVLARFAVVQRARMAAWSGR